MDEIIKLDALFFGAHPDDIELTCGGTVLKLNNSGKKTGIVDLTKGELSTRGTLETRQAETQKASSILGISARENLELQDGNIVNDEASRLKVIKAIRRYKPQLVFAPYPLDRHPDHIHASELVRDAFFNSGLRKIITEGLNAHRPAKIYYYPQASDIPVTFVMDISDTFEKKMEAVMAYSTQFFNIESGSNEPKTLISSELFYNTIAAKARFHGFKINAKFGEAFFSYDTVKVDEKTIFDI